jgi:hypothetical protein
MTALSQNKQVLPIDTDTTTILPYTTTQAQANCDPACQMLGSSPLHPAKGDWQRSGCACLGGTLVVGGACARRRGWRVRLSLGLSTRPSRGLVRAGTVVGGRCLGLPPTSNTCLGWVLSTLAVAGTQISWRPSLVRRPSCAACGGCCRMLLLPPATVYATVCSSRTRTLSGTVPSTSYFC